MKKLFIALISASTLAGCVSSISDIEKDYANFPNIKLCQILMGDAYMPPVRGEQAAANLLKQRGEDCSDYKADATIEVK